MAERPAEKQNWYAHFVESYGPTFRIDINNPQMGYGGEDVYTMYGVTKQNQKSSIGLDQNGKLKIHSDVSIELVAGELAGDRSEDILIHSRRGNISITADRTGTVKIKGSHIVLEADGDLDLIAGNDIVASAGNIFRIQGNGAEIEGLTGNLVPPEKHFLFLVFKGSFVGADVILGLLGIALPK
jgi:hypothetical protein